MAAAHGLLLALSEGRDEAAWEQGKALATAVLDDKMNVLAKAVLEGGPFAMRRAEELAELVLGEPGDKKVAEGANGARKV